MITFETTLIIFFSIIGLMLLFRYFNKGKLYFTSHYKVEKEFTIDEITLKQNILSALQKAHFKKIKNNDNQISAITVPTIFSFSELIKTEIDKVSESKFNVTFSSICFLPTQIFDWGKNKRNSNLFFKNLEISLSQLNKK
ncbi:hypothetical protein [Flavobacterium piscis]|uniref:Uncharacterized protein n=1 Tax=Flavobacterium piscis TaxID=1114874 RepID=A0ABU1Y6C7_9FLAO|nr:hypothetical protein [Flavobacterium piscis]MDR7209777.1 hypothetical protein [Flavobacterium piscis]